MVRSGEVGCCRCRWVCMGSQVGWLSLMEMMEWLAPLIKLLIVVPLWSVIGENHD